jgi:hypothetical protein
MRRAARNVAKAITIKAPRRRKASPLMNPPTLPKVAGRHRSRVLAVRWDREWGQVEAVQDVVGGAAGTVAGRHRTTGRRRAQGVPAERSRTMSGKNSVILIYHRSSVR